MSVTHTRSTRLAVAGFVAVLIGGGVLSGQSATGNLRPVGPRMGMVGIADGQTARLNIVNVGVVDPTTGFPPGPCRVRLQIVDADGNELASRGVAPEMGHAKFLDFTPSFVPVNGAAVTPLRAEIRAVVLTDNGLPPGPCRVTLEIFDNVTGRTQVLFPTPWRGLSPPPDPGRTASQ